MRLLATRAWAYAVELIAAGSVCSFFWMLIGIRKIAEWELEKRTDLLASIGLATAISAAIFAAFFALLSTEFGKRLRLHGAAAEYTAAFAFPMALFGITAIALESTGKNTGLVLARIVTFLLCYSCLNCLSMIRNVIGLVRLWQEVERAVEQKSEK